MGRLEFKKRNRDTFTLTPGLSMSESLKCSRSEETDDDDCAAYSYGYSSPDSIVASESDDSSRPSKIRKTVST